MEKKRIKVYRSALTGGPVRLPDLVSQRTMKPGSAEPATAPVTAADIAASIITDAQHDREARARAAEKTPPAAVETPVRARRLRCSASKPMTASETGAAPWEATQSEEEAAPAKPDLPRTTGTIGTALASGGRRDARDIFPPHPGRAQERPSPVTTALELLAGGHSDLAAVRHLREGHNLSLEQAQAALETAYQKLASTQQRDLEQKMALAVEQRSRIAAAALEQSDFRIALTAMEQRDKLLGLTGPEALNGNVAASSLLQLLQDAAIGSNQTGPAYAKARSSETQLATH